MGWNYGIISMDFGLIVWLEVRVYNTFLQMNYDKKETHLHFECPDGRQFSANF